MECTTFLPSSDPRSSINPAPILRRLAGKCHKGVTQKFMQTKVHLQDGASRRDPDIAGDIDSLAVRLVRLDLHCR